MERVDGTQARLKQPMGSATGYCRERGKGGWDSGEIETIAPLRSALQQ